MQYAPAYATYQIDPTKDLMTLSKVHIQGIKTHRTNLSN
jgi:hypothetical protein